MSAKLPNMPTEWVDSDDAAELGDEFFNKATPRVGERLVSHAEFAGAASKAIRMGRPRAANPKMALTVRYDSDVIEAFRATGSGWQTRMNEALRDWLKTHSPA